MWQYEQFPQYDLPDVQRFSELINAHADFWISDAPITVARANHG